MSSTFNRDESSEESAEARFLAKVMETLDASLTQLPQSMQERLDGVRHAAMAQAQEAEIENDFDHVNYGRVFTDSEKQIPETVKTRLDEIRAQAMQRARNGQNGTERSWIVQAWWSKLWPPRGFAVPASAFASVCMLVTTLAIFNMPESPESMPLAVAENSLVLASEEEIELYENLEFYQWLADNGL